MSTTLTIASPILAIVWSLWIILELITRALGNEALGLFDLSPDQITDADDGARVCLGFHEERR